MTARSWLFVPADSDRKIERALASESDVIMFDLEDSVSQDRKAISREGLSRRLEARRPEAGGLEARQPNAGTASPSQQWWVRINPLNTPDALPDLCAVITGAIHGVFLPKPTGASDVVTLDHYLSALEARNGLAPHSIRIMTVVESARGMLRQHEFPRSSPRLSAMTWGAEDMASDLGASTNRDDGGKLFTVHQINRSYCLVMAAAGNFLAIDTPCMDYRNQDLLETECRLARREGFVGKMAIHPDQVASINQAFTPSAEEVSHAQRVIRAFEESGGQGAVGMDGRMLDLPHLKQAQRVLERARGMGREIDGSVGGSGTC